MSSVLSKSELDPFLYIWYYTVRTQRGLSPCVLNVKELRLKSIGQNLEWDVKPQTNKNQTKNKNKKQNKKHGEVTIKAMTPGMRNNAVYALNQYDKSQRARATNGKIGPVDLSKNEND